MSHYLGSMTGASILATDGSLGSVSDFFFDDLTWTVRYLVVDTSHWLSRRHVLIATSAVREPDWEKQRFPVELTKEQVRHSPEVDTERTVSREEEIGMNRYFGWPTDWPGYPSGTYAAERDYPPHGDSSHLRSAWDVAGYEVWSPDGDMGSVEDYILDQTSWHIGGLVVRKVDWLHSQDRLISTSRVDSIDWATRRIQVVVARAGSS